MITIPGVSVIIPTLNEEKYLPVLLESLSKITSPLEVIIVDGGSTDHTAQVAAEAKTRFGNTVSGFKFIVSSKKGISLQRNLGGAEATFDLLLFCDADAVAMSPAVHEYFVTDFVRRACVVATSKIVPLEPSFRVSLVHATAYTLQKILYFLHRPYFNGAYLLTTKQVFRDIGGFDEALRVSEDVDYSLRAAKRGGYKLYNLPVKVSTRRFKKYGYKWIFKNPMILVRLIKNGKIHNNDKIHYPFGEY